MPAISLAIATYNEEEVIARCLLSVSDLVSEIILVDGYSSDHTVEIARKFNARIILSKNVPMFHINKQKAINECKSDWILQLDADEEVTSKLMKEIISCVENPSESNGFWIPRKNFFLGRFLKKGGQYPDYTMRLYRNGKGHLPCKSVHEQAVIKGKTSYISQALLHYSYPDFHHYLSHFNLYTDLLSQELTNPGIFDMYLLKPVGWFLKTYIRHLGFLDGFPGFVFSFFSALRFPVAYTKYWELRRVKSDRP